MSRFKDKVGNIYGNLTVIKFVGFLEYKNNKNSVWMCQCSCGKKVEISSSGLNSRKSCGCLLTLRNKKRALKEGEAQLNVLFKRYQNRAKRKHLSFSLTLDVFRSITSSNCFYCNKKPEQVLNYKTCRGKYYYNGIDRKQNCLGYDLENCVAACANCNMMKRILTLDDFLSHIKSIYKHSILESKVK